MADEGTNVITRADIEDRMYRTGKMTRKEAKDRVDLVFDAIENALKSGQKAFIFGFGTFQPVVRAARTISKPRTGEKMEVPASTAVKFKPSSVLKEAVRG